MMVKNLRPMGVCCITLLSISAVSAHAQNLEVDTSVSSQRSYILQTCPRAAAFTEEFDAVLQPEAYWNTAKPTGSSVSPESGLALGLVAALSEPVVQSGLNALGAWLNERANDRQSTTSWIANGYAAAIANDGVSTARDQCIVLVRGRFGSAKAVTEAETTSKAPSQDDPSIKLGSWSADWLKAYNLAEPPTFYGEIRMVYASDSAAVRLVPEIIEFRESGIAERPHEPRELILAVVFSQRGIAAGATALLLASDATPGHLMGPSLLEANQSPWVSWPVPEEKSGVPNRKLLLSTPMTVQASLVETLDPSRFDRLIADTFALAKEPIASAIATAVPGANDDAGGMKEVSPN